LIRYVGACLCIEYSWACSCWMVGG